MSDTAVETQAATDNADKIDPEVLVLDAKASTKKGSKAKGKTPKGKATPKAKATNQNKKAKKSVSDLHPKYSQMINEAISALKDRNGSSRQAILKYIMANYNVLSDEKVVNNHIKMSIRAGVKSGKLKQSKGSGACGSYKLGDKNSVKASKIKAANSKSPTKKASLTKVKKPKVVSKVTKSPTKKASPDKPSPKSSPQKTKPSPKKSPKKSKSPKKTKAKKTKQSPKKSKKTTEPETQSETAAPEQAAE